MQTHYSYNDEHLTNILDVCKSQVFFISQSVYDGDYTIFFAWEGKHDIKFDTTVAIFKVKKL